MNTTIKQLLRKEINLTKQLLKWINQINTVYTVNISTRGRDSATTYALVPEELRGIIKPQKAVCKFVKKGNTKYLIYQVK